MGDERVAELETETMMLRRALKHAMAHLILLRAGDLTPEEEAASYAAVLGEATAACQWTNEKAAQR